MVDCFDTSDNQQQHHLAGHQVKKADHHKSLGHLVSPKYPESTEVHQVVKTRYAGCPGISSNCESEGS
jgi:hypothetical protein